MAAVDIYGVPMRRLAQAYCRGKLVWLVRQPDGRGLCQGCGKLHRVVW
jgi:hypothetical protein